MHQKASRVWKSWMQFRLGTPSTSCAIITSLMDWATCCITCLAIKRLPRHCLNPLIDFVVSRLLDYKMGDSKTVISQIQKYQVLLHEFKQRGWFWANHSLWMQLPRSFLTRGMTSRTTLEDLTEMRRLTTAPRKSLGTSIWSRPLSSSIRRSSIIKGRNLRVLGWCCQEICHS